MAEAMSAADFLQLVNIGKLPLKRARCANKALLENLDCISCAPQGSARVPGVCVGGGTQRTAHALLLFSSRDGEDGERRPQTSVSTVPRKSGGLGITAQCKCFVGVDVDQIHSEQGARLCWWPPAFVRSDPYSCSN
ncbi:hypothetical protein Anapl_10912 [Anas platyrhynchos]|uniref:Uncharacterized protein n=1 Tax=Anas platyrhynchos TaxID=8839 RepID=R0KYZ8_ANAPL|nr:hypothetical protein Anapl_10912 [Anas platyrhynchos]